MDYLVNEHNEGEAGFIAVDRDGNVSMETNTGSMFEPHKARKDGSYLEIVLYP